MHILQKVTIFLLLQFFTLYCYAANPSQILILHSYSQEYPWTKTQHQAFISELNAHNPADLIVSTEYLDTKRRAFDTDYISSFYDYLAVKYDNYSPGIIYVSDDNALTFALGHLHRLFPDAAIVFSGVNDYSIKDSLDHKRVTGVFEKKDISRNLELLDSIDTYAKDILVIGDNSNTYKAIESEVKQQLKKFPEIKATFFASHSIEELQKKIKNHPAKYLFITTVGAMTDSSGQFLSLNETLTTISNAADKIILSMEDTYVMDGVLGGFVTSGEQQGLAAAHLVTDLLSGTAVEKLDFVSDSPNKYLFDFAILEATAISLPDDVLAEATLLNKPLPFYIRHRSVITGLIIGLTILLILSLSLFLVLLTRKNREIRSTSIQTQELEQIIFDRTMALSDEKQKLTQAQEIAHIGNYTWKIEADKTTWSDELYNITGHMPDRFNPSYHNYLNCIHPDDRDNFIQLTKSIFKNKKRYHAEYRLVRPGGEIRHVHEQGDVKLDGQGELLSLVGVIHDITERKTSEDEYLRLQRELNQAHKMEALGQLTGGIAHDFNNILAIISGYTNLITENCKNKLDEKLARYLENIDLATIRATDLVSKMMVFSRDDKGDNEPLLFAPLIEDSIKMLRSIIPSSIDIDYDFEDGLPEIMMDKTQLHQVLMNLAINAKDAMNGIGKLSIKLAWLHELNNECNACHKHVDGDWVVLSISDTGSGINNDVVDRIFEPFFTTKKIGQGTGMGLSVLNAIVEGHGGHILIDTEPGSGTTFKLLFPPALAVSQHPTEDNTQEAQYGTSAKGEKILIVDDEPFLTDFLSEALGSHGYECTTCNQSPEALCLVEENPERFDLVITDQTMPQLLGSDMIEKIREIRPEMPVILTTGYSDSITSEQAESLGISYMDKPIDISQLYSTLAKLLSKKEATHQASSSLWKETNNQSPARRSPT